MNNHAGMTKGFIHFRSAWYADKVMQPAEEVDHVHFGYYAPDGGTTGEMVMIWNRLGPDDIAPRLAVFNDAWSALATFSDVIAALGKLDDQHITPTQFCDLLRAHGFTDLTQRTKGGN